MKRRLLVALAAVSVFTGSSGVAETNTGEAQHDSKPPSKNSSQLQERRESRTHFDQRMAWWREARFGMFIHWGIYSIPAGIWKGQRKNHGSEWIMHDMKIPIAEYAALTNQFDPTNFNAGTWVKLARAAGMKYIIFTAKHHDGFAMYHTHVDDYNIYDATPFKRDPLAELAAACNKEGIRLGVYYSQAQDWFHPGGQARGGHWDKAQDGSMDDYIDKVAVPQVRELLSNYGKIAVLWWDEPINMTTERVGKLLPLLKLQLAIITNNRLDQDKKTGDFFTPEQKIPTNGFPGHDWETCMTINGTWGYKSYDTNWKSAKVLIRNLVDIASKGGNYLLNVGPTSTGTIPQPEVERLQEMGRWMKVNEEAIYGTSASPFGHPFVWGRCTEKSTPEGTVLYLHVFDWPNDGRLVVDGLKSKTKQAYLLEANQHRQHTTLAAVNERNKVTITLPEVPPNEISSTIVLKIHGIPEID